ncbi:MAG: UvrD-helicase domain-containing protein [Candidatus Sumerlaeaceae bacterium]|nr:UvrD-helicase domain-containing protein [Candidatus Sumerlaeaceae bacterium]
MNDEILENLNPGQYQAVTAPDGPQLVIAGAGSGKTRVITRRIAYLVKHRGIRPWEIFAATFTNKAAEEMKRRIGEMLPETNPRDFHIGTFHSLCARILRREHALAGLDPGFTICDETDQLRAVRQVIRDLGADEKRYTPAAAQHIINQAKMRMLDPGDLGDLCDSDREDTYAEIYRSYLKYMRNNAAVDFEDLILKVVRLFQNEPSALSTYQRRYRHVMVDEYQDANAVQFELVRLLAAEHGNLMVVGDEDQSIYSWRGADISKLLDFKTYFPNANYIRLEQNYRSHGNILKAAGGVIARNSERLDGGKTLFTELPDGQPIYVLSANGEIEESTTVAYMIESLVRSSGFRYEDIAIFYRVSALSRVFEDALRSLNIPYRVVGGMRFYDRAEIKDLIACLQVVQNPSNAIALLRIINTPRRGLGAKSVQAIIDLARRKDIPEFEAIRVAIAEGLLPAGATKSLKLLVKLVESWQALSRTDCPSAVLRQILKDTDYVTQLGDQRDLDVRSRTENIEELVNSLVLFEGANPQATLSEYLENVSLVSPAEDEGIVGNQVSMMTLHGAKGLEFRAVFIVGLDDTIFPNTRAVMEEGRLEEERRLFYVGITRARELLVLTRSSTRVMYGEIRYCIPSDFLRELPAEVVEPLDFGSFDFLALRPGFGNGEPSSCASEKAQHSISAEVEPTKSEKPRSVGGYEIGMRVRHPILGDGLIVGITDGGRDARLLFRGADGKNTQLMARYSNLEVLQRP